MIIKNSKIIEFLAYIKVDLEKNFISKYTNFLIIDHCINLCEFIEDIKEQKDTVSYLKNSINQQIAILQKDKNEIKNISLNEKDFNFLDKDIFNIFEYKFNQLKINKENYLNSYLNLICN